MPCGLYREVVSVCRLMLELVHILVTERSSTLEPHDIIYKLQNVKPSGAGWSAKCPAHNDNKNSLSVELGSDNRILLCCHAGCSTGEINSALSVEMHDLFSNLDNRSRTNTPKSRIVAEYD